MRKPIPPSAAEDEKEQKTGKLVKLAHNREVEVTTISGDVLTILPGKGLKRVPIRLEGAEQIIHKPLRKSGSGAQ